MLEIYETKERVTADNDKAAAETREKLKENRTFFVNLMASPGAGKTTLLKQTITALKDTYRIGVMEADVDSAVDAAEIEKTGVRVIQLHSGGLCHMDADMTQRGLDKLNVKGLDLVFLENIGNLVCPAEFDVGSQIRAMILSVPEGDDKPLKYPLMFKVSDVVLVNKIDALPVFDFDKERFEKNVRTRNEKAPVIYLSALTGENCEAWIAYLKEAIENWRQSA
ncbi:MAG: hydrogenase nickel incorporation protein HypB [Erysipelotrichaceae bacterium]|nr:hydrogenase nickel incorporation protein HypB [Erysipelotrichaceae bacterium]